MQRYIFLLLKSNAEISFWPLILTTLHEIGNGFWFGSLKTMLNLGLTLTLNTFESLTNFLYNDALWKITYSYLLSLHTNCNCITVTQRAPGHFLFWKRDSLLFLVAYDCWLPYHHPCSRISHSSSYRGVQVWFCTVKYRENW